MKLIFAQGNPDPQYAKTRHNTGFMVMDAYADAHKTAWKEVSKFNAKLAEATVNGEKVLLVKPLSFYNDTGLVARQLIDFYKIDATRDFLAIHDDLALPFGTLRIRENGGDAGNNGVKSLNQHLGPMYTRIRIGIWSEERDRMDDVDFVLGKFNHGQAEKLEKHILTSVGEMIDSFVAGTLEVTSKQLLEK